MNNGKQISQPNGIPPGSAFVTVFAHPSLQGPGNPNGVAVTTNFPQGNKKYSLAGFSLLLVGTHPSAEPFRIHPNAPLAPDILTPEWSAAPLASAEQKNT